MTLRRAALYAGGASLLAAWFSSAASLSVSRGSSPDAQVATPSGAPIDDLALQVRMQSRRLRERLTSVPRAVAPIRDPFRFRQAEPPAVPAVRQSAAPMALPQPVEPPLTLAGIAEQNRAEGSVRTALIVASGDQLLMVTVGESVLQRYTVAAIGSDFVELADGLTGRTRRLALEGP